MNGDFSDLKRIAIIIDTLNGGGAEKFCITLAKGMMQWGVEVHLFVMKKHCNYDIPAGVNIHFFFDDTKIKLYSRRVKARAVDKLRSAVSQIGHFDAYFSNLNACHPIVDEAKLPNTFFIIHNSVEHALKRSALLGPIKYWREKSALRHLNGKNLIGVSRGVSDEISQGLRINPRSVTTIYNPLDLDLIRKEASLKLPLIPDEPYIIFVGRVAKQKRIDVLLKAYQSLKSDVSLVYLGNNAKKLLRTSDKLNITRRIQCFDFSQNPYAWIKNAKALVLSSDYEGFGMVLAEALACGTPVASTACPHGPDEILDGELSNFLAPPASPEKLAEKIDLAIAHPDLFNNAKILEEIAVEKVSQRYLTLVQDTLLAEKHH